MTSNDLDSVHETARRLERVLWLLDRPLAQQIYADRDLLTDLLPNPGFWVISEPYVGQAFDPSRAKIVPGGWNDYCDMCFARIEPGDAWWAVLPLDESGLCSDCHEVLIRYGPALKAAGLIEDRGRRRQRSVRKRAAAAMTEAGWLASTVPRAMVLALEEPARSGNFNRPLRLFACACVRDAWHLLHDERSRRAVEVAERYAEGFATPEELCAAHEAAREAGADMSTAMKRHAEEKARIEGLPDVGPTGTVSGELLAERVWRAALAARSVTGSMLRELGKTAWYERGAWDAALSVPEWIFLALADAAVLRAREAARTSANDARGRPLAATDPIAGVAEILARDAARDEVSDALVFYDDPRQTELLRRFIDNPFRS